MATDDERRPPGQEAPPETTDQSSPGQDIATAARHGRSAAARIDWAAVVHRAAEIVDSYDTGVTLRQLFYRLVSEQAIPNSTGAYKGLSARTAEARRAGEFPDLIDRGREIHGGKGGWKSPGQSIRAHLRGAANRYRRDRSEGQPFAVYLGVEKAGMVIQLTSWFDEKDLPVLALGGYSSQTYVDGVVDHVRRQRRPAVLLYLGDHDPSGEDIDRDFVARTGCWDKVVRIALTAAQVREHDLPPLPGKVTDSRAAGFIAKHGELVQVELDALPPDVLRDLAADAVAEFWDTSTFDEVLARENEDVSMLGRWVAALDARLGELEAS